MGLTTVFLGAKESAKRVLTRSEIDPNLVVSFAEEHYDTEDGATYEKLDDRWFPVESINTDRCKGRLRELDPDVIFAVSWPELLEAEVLSIPTHGCVGRHISLLPKRRGRAPVAWAILQNLEKTGVTLFWLDEGVDTGDIIEQRSFSITYDDDASTVYEKASDTTVELLDHVLELFEAGEFPREPQDESEATFTHPRRPDMGLIDWTNSAQRLYHFIRAQTKPYPGAFTYHRMDKISVWSSKVHHDTATEANPGRILERIGGDHYRVQTGEGVLDVEVENRDGRHPVEVGSIFGCEGGRYDE